MTVPTANDSLCGVTMTHDFEYMVHHDADQIATGENASTLTGAPEPPPLFFAPPYAADEVDGGATDDQAALPPYRPDERTEALISHGRQRTRRRRAGWLRSHWRAAAAGTGGALLAVIALLVAVGGGGAGWPPSVATVRSQIATACRNPDVAAEPSQLNFACAASSRQILWVFSLLTSGDDPGFRDKATGRKGLEPIQPTQGGDIAWSLNLHHPYNPANPVDSLQVAARAINNIIGGATLTSSNGAPHVEPGLEGKAANCRRYTGSARLVSKTGYPPRCARPVTSQAGLAALVSDVFQQWMGGMQSRMAAEAGVLFTHAGDPGSPQVQAILASLATPAS